MHQHQSEVRELKREADARLSRLSLLLRMLWVGGVLLAGCLCAMAAKEFAMPAARAARTYPAHDEHPAEKITVAIDPYDVDAKASIFSVKYRNFDLVPIFFVITNDGDQPISLAGATFYLMGVQDASGKEVMYFEIPLEKYLGSGEGKRP